MSPEPVRTERLVLREPQAEDCEVLADLWVDPDVRRCLSPPRERDFLLGCFRESVADPEAYRKRWSERFWVVLDAATSGLVGAYALSRKDVEGRIENDLAYFFFPRAWRRGYASESAPEIAAIAFGELGLESLVAIIHPDNAASQGVARKLGMQYERTLVGSDWDRLVFRLKRS